MRPIRPLMLAALLLLAHAGLAAGQVVLFSDGRSMLVERVEIAGRLIRLTLEDGSRIGVPSGRVTKWEKLPEDPVPAELPPLPEAWRSAAGPYAGVIETAALQYRLDPALLTAVAQVESAFDPRAVSPKGACGLLQLMPATAKRFGVEDVFDAGQNVEAGARYLSWLLDRYDGQTELALAGYNAGEGAVDRHSGIPPYRETRRYVGLVLEGVGRLGTPLSH